MSYRGNRAALEADVEKVVGLMMLETPGYSANDLMRRYHVAWPTMIQVLRPRFSDAQWARMARNRRLRATAATRFKPGLTPWNKGLKGIHLSPATEFKAGNLSGSALRRYKCEGTIVIRLEPHGVRRRWIKAAGWRRPFVEYARWLWHRDRGPVPAGWVLVHLDGCSMNDAIENLAPMSRADAMRHYRTLHPMRPGDPIAAAAKATRTRAITHRLRQLRKSHHAPVSLLGGRWECRACSADYDRQPPRCTKCGGMTFLDLAPMAKGGAA